MTDRLRLILEIGKKRRIVAGAMDWPGLDRWGISEDDAIQKLSSYLPRYAGVAQLAGLGSAFARAGGVEVVERVPESSSTKFWGIAHVPSPIEREVLSGADLERRLDLLADEHLVVGRDRPVDAADLHDLGRAVSIAHRGLHDSPIVGSAGAVMPAIVASQSTKRARHRGRGPRKRHSPSQGR